MASIEFSDKDSTLVLRLFLMAKQLASDKVDLHIEQYAGRSGEGCDVSGRSVQGVYRRDKQWRL